MMGVFGGIIAALFGVFWTAMTIRMRAPFFFAMFGVIFIVAAIVNTVYNYKNATGKNRMSLYDITDEDDEPDPFNKYANYGKSEIDRSVSFQEEDDNTRYCPYCGEALKRDYEYCPKCGKQV